MKTKATLLAILLSTAGTTWASGGQSIDSVDVSSITSTEVEVTKITVQGPIDAFDVMATSSDKDRVDTSALKQAYDGRS